MLGASATNEIDIQNECCQLKLQQLRYLLAIADNGLSVTAAANQLCTSQPGVSKQLKLLEDELGLQLFARNGKSLSRITTAGDRIIVHARVIMREVDDILSLCQDLANEEPARRVRSASCK